MRISVEEAEDRLEELVQRAEAGEEILLTLKENVTVRFEPVQRRDIKSRGTVAEG